MSSERTVKVQVSQGHLRQQLEALLEQLGYINEGEHISSLAFETYAFNPNDHYYDSEVVPITAKVCKDQKEVQTIIFNGKNRS